MSSSEHFPVVSFALSSSSAVICQERLFYKLTCVWSKRAPAHSFTNSWMYMLCGDCSPLCKWFWSAACACFRANSDSAIHSSTLAAPVPQSYPSMNSSPSPTSNGRTGQNCWNFQLVVNFWDGKCRRLFGGSFYQPLFVSGYIYWDYLKTYLGSVFWDRV